MSIDKTQLSNALIDFIVKDLASDKDVDNLQPSDDLLEDSVVDSLGIMRLITFIEQRFGYSVPSEDVVIENFMTVDAISDYLVSKLAENAQ